MMRAIEGMFVSYRSRDCFPHSTEEVAGKEVDLVYTGQPYNILPHSYRRSSFC